MPVCPIPNVAAFADVWWTWWIGLQPPWRRSTCQRLSVNDRVLPDNADWEALWTSGQNGLLSVVATLYWWGFAEKGAGTGTASADWANAVANTTWVMRAIGTSPAAPHSD
jgi:hypothetical protein